MARALLMLAVLLGGCVLGGCATATGGGRARLGGAEAVGDTAGRGAGVTLKAGITPLAWFLPDREWDLEGGYVLEAFPADRQLDVHGGYFGVTAVPTLVQETHGQFRIRLLAGVDAEVMGGIDRVVMGATATLGVEVAGFWSGADSRGSIGQGYAIAVAGEWALGLSVFGSYRYAVDEGHYGMIGGGVSIRFPGAAAAGYVLPLDLDEAVRGETPEENRARHRRRTEMRRARRELRRVRRGPAPTAVQCVGGAGTVEAPTLAEGRRLCPDCECDYADVPPAPE